ncbi:hypothetical protein PCK1_002543 [Pneumocystis canis]|nr:hypothetical protein PCK1_002543 [Pneumocystis canis]
MNPLIQSLDANNMLEKIQKCVQELSHCFENNQFLCQTFFKEIGLDELNELDKLEASVLENQSKLQTVFNQVNTHLIPFFEQLYPINEELKSLYESIDELEKRVEKSKKKAKQMKKTLQSIKNALEEEEKSIRDGTPKILRQ